MHACERVCAHSIHAQTHTGTGTDNFEFPLYTADRRRVDVLLNATPRRMNSGQVREKNTRIDRWREDMRVCMHACMHPIHPCIRVSHSQTRIEINVPETRDDFPFRTGGRFRPLLLMEWFRDGATGGPGGQFSIVGKWRRWHPIRVGAGGWHARFRRPVTRDCEMLATAVVQPVVPRQSSWDDVCC